MFRAFLFDGTRTELLVSLSNRHSSVYATAGFPAVTVPAGMRSNGMPVGVPSVDAALAKAGIKLDVGGRAAFRAAQHLQDNSRPWGDAVEGAESYLASRDRLANPD